MDDDLRAKLDAASLLPRGRWKELWVAAAAELVAPVRERVMKALADRTTDGAAEALAWVESPSAPPPRASWRAWTAALNSLMALDRDELRPQLRERARAMAKALQAASDGEAAERALPLFLAALGPAEWKVRYPLLRAKWLEALPMGVAVAVACLQLDEPDLEVFRDNAFVELGKVRDLSSAARGAMWIVVWADRHRLGRRWDTLASLGEPAAIAVILHDSFLWADRLPMRPALTKALCRVIRREDPWLELQRAPGEYGAPDVALVIERALEVLPRVAQATGTEALARETLDARWASLGLAGAVARGRLGGADAVPALVAGLGGAIDVKPDERAEDAARRRTKAIEDALLALACVGHGAAVALPAVRGAAECTARTLALAAIEPTDASLEALVPLVVRTLENAGEYRMQYEEGLVTLDEYARRFDDAEFVLRLWTAHGLTPARRELIEKLRETLAREHEAIAGDAIVARLIVPRASPADNREDGSTLPPA